MKPLTIIALLIACLFAFANCDNGCMGCDRVTYVRKERRRRIKRHKRRHRHRRHHHRRRQRRRR